MDYPIYYPASIDLLVYVTDGKQRTGTATISFKPGKEVTRQEIVQRVAQFEKEDMPDGFRLMTKPEIWDMVCEDVAGKGARFAMPGSVDFDK